MDNRRHPRFEPAFIDAMVTLSDKTQLIGRVLDSSRSGMAIALSEKSHLPAPGSSVILSVAEADSHGSQKSVGSATVERTWSDTELIDKEKGIALKFSTELNGNSVAKYLLRGFQQNKRLNSQAKLAVIDIEYLGGYRRDLISCQIRLFILTLTVSVALASAYFGLTYHSIATNQLANPNLSFWRTMVAALPGALALACAFMVVQKSTSIQRVDAYLLLLKQYLILEQYPREFKGWESEYRKFRNALKTKICKTCEVKPKCGNLTLQEVEKLQSRTLFAAPKIDLYHLVMYTSFFSAFALSLTVVVVELLKFQWGVTAYMIVSSLITICFLFATVALFYAFYHLRKGRFSVVYYKRCWVDLLNKCRWQA